MYGRIKEEKLRSGNIDFSVKKVKGELEGSMDVESKRVNIDSAKKRAVLQGMDYEGFRQMVLGAHLFKISSKELINLNADRTGNKAGDSIVLNSAITTFNNVVDLSMRQRDEIELTNMRIAEMLANNELSATNFRMFKKSFDSQYKEPIDDICAQNIFLFFYVRQMNRLLKSQREENLKKIFNLDFDVSYFIKMVKVIRYITSESLVQNKNTRELSFLMNFIKELTKIKDFSFVIPKFLNAKEKLEVKELIVLWTQVIPSLYIAGGDSSVKEAHTSSETSENNTTSEEKSNIEKEEVNVEDNPSHKTELEVTGSEQKLEVSQETLQVLLADLTAYFMK